MKPVIEFELLCPFGLIDDLSVLQIASKTSNCTHFISDEATEDSCNMKASYTSQFSKCVGKGSCRAVLLSSELSSTSPTPCLKPTVNTSLFVSAVCAAQAIEVYDSKISRKSLTYIIVICDMLICILFVLNALWIYEYTKREAKEQDKNATQITDFSVRIKGFNLDDETKSPAYLRVLLDEHIKRVLQDGQSRNDPVQSDIVSIHFGLRNFSNYALLQKIEAIGKQG